MLRDITLGQYYPVDSLIHRLDPRTKLFGTMVFILSLFVANNIWGYLLGTIALAAVIVLTKVPVRFILKGLKAIVIPVRRRKHWILLTLAGSIVTVG